MIKYWIFALFSILTSWYLLAYLNTKHSIESIDHAFVDYMLSLSTCYYWYTIALIVSLQLVVFVVYRYHHQHLATDGTHETHCSQGLSSNCYLQIFNCISIAIIAICYTIIAFIQISLSLPKTMMKNIQVSGYFNDIMLNQSLQQEHHLTVNSNTFQLNANHGLSHQAQPITDNKQKASYKFYISDGIFANHNILLDPSNIADFSFSATALYSLKINIFPLNYNDNIYDFNYMNYLYTQNIVARASLERVLLDHKTKAGIFNIILMYINQVRSSMINYLYDKLQNQQYAGLFIALATGYQKLIPEDQWVLFRQTGIIHLISISGFHITCLAGFFLLFIRFILNRFIVYYSVVKIPVQIISIWITLIIATVYALLSNFSIPTQRSLYFMLILGVLHSMRINLSAHNALLLSLVVVLILDPLSSLSYGFWLSFILVSAIYYVNKIHNITFIHPVSLHHKRLNYQNNQAKVIANKKKIIIKLNNTLTKMILWLKIQLSIAVFSFPILLYLFGEYSFIAIIANLWAVPIIGGIITPIVLLGSLVHVDILLYYLHILLTYSLKPIIYLRDYFDVLQIMINHNLHLFLSSSAFFDSLTDLSFSMTNYKQIRPNLSAVIISYCGILIFYFFGYCRLKKAIGLILFLSILFVNNHDTYQVFKLNNQQHHHVSHAQKYSFITVFDLGLIGGVFIHLKNKNIILLDSASYLDGNQQKTLNAERIQPKTFNLELKQQAIISALKRSIIPYLLTHEINSIDNIFLANHDSYFDNNSLLDNYLDNIYSENTQAFYSNLVNVLRQHNITVKLSNIKNLYDIQNDTAQTIIKNNQVSIDKTQADAANNQQKQNSQKQHDYIYQADNYIKPEIYNLYHNQRANIYKTRLYLARDNKAYCLLLISNNLLDISNNTSAHNTLQNDRLRSTNYSYLNNIYNNQALIITNSNSFNATNICDDLLFKHHQKHSMQAFNIDNLAYYIVDMILFLENTAKINIDKFNPYHANDHIAKDDINTSLFTQYSSNNINNSSIIIFKKLNNLIIGNNVNWQNIQKLDQLELLANNIIYIYESGMQTILIEEL